MADYMHFVFGWLGAVVVGVPFAIWYLVMERQRFQVEVWVKPTPVLALALFLLIAYLAGVAQQTTYTILVVIALLLSAIADSVFVCADWSAQRKVVPISRVTSAIGVLLFFLVQVLWIMLFTFSPALSGGVDPTSESAPLRIWILIGLAVFASFGLGLMMWLHKAPQELELLFVSVYVIASIVSVWRAGARVGYDSLHQRLDSQIIALVGICLFATSDACIYLQYYVVKSPASRFIVMLLYWAAQALLTLSSFLFV